jgi:hypothetical protein
VVGGQLLSENTVEEGVTSMLHTGDAVLEAHYPRGVEATRRVPCRREAIAARDAILERITQRQAAHWGTVEKMPPEVRMFGDALYTAGVAKALPTGALAHHTMQLGWHQDRNAPAESTNLLVVFRHECSGGMLVIADEQKAYRLWDGEYHLFDPRSWHGLTPVQPTRKDAYRLGITYYIPTT